MLPRLAADASASIRAFCHRPFTLAVYDELYTAVTPSRQIVLNQYPVLSVDRVATCPTQVLSVTNTATSTNQRARAALQSVDNGDGTLTATGITLTSVASGATSAASVPFSSNPTLSAVAAAVAGLGNGWSASCTGYELEAAADLRAPQGGFACKAPSAALFTIHLAELSDYALDARAGILTLGDSPASDPVGSPRWGPAWSGGSLDDAASYSGLQGVRVVYTAGFTAVPADVVVAAVETVKAALERPQARHVRHGRIGRDSELVGPALGRAGRPARGRQNPTPPARQPEGLTMRRPSGRMVPSRVTVVRTSWAGKKDTAAGRASTDGAAEGPYACAVQPASSAEVPAQMRDTNVVYYTVKFYEDLGLKIRDEVHWNGLTLVVTGPRPSSGGAGRSFEIGCEGRA